MSRIDVAAYIWPSYTGDEPRTRIFWEEGIGEWQTVKNTEPKDNGYFWNRKPLRKRFAQQSSLPKSAVSRL